jgi:hypothetical protein
MTFLTESLTFTSSLTSGFRQRALEFGREQKDAQKARQVYLNTLAVQAVHFYCKCIGVETELTASDSWSAATRSLINVADLVVKGKGRLECRPALPGDEVCDVPPEVQEERLGYVVVAINEETYEAKLLGFSPTAAEGRLFIRRLLSLEGLIDTIIDDVPEREPSPLLGAAIKTNLVRIGQWFQGVFDEVWQESGLVLATSYRGAGLTQEPESLPFRKKAKLLDIGEYKVALVVQVAQVSAIAWDILLKICPSNSNILPQGLFMQLFDDSGSVVMETRTQRADNFRSLQFQIGTEEAFSIKIGLGDISVVEQFVS